MRVPRERERTATPEELEDERQRWMRATSRRRLATTVEVPVIATAAHINVPKAYRDENWYTECAETQEMPAIIQGVQS
jgi:hypothetical protein